MNQPNKNDPAEVLRFALSLVEAQREGKAIEIYGPLSGKWIECDGISARNIGGVVINIIDGAQYRVKPEPRKAWLLYSSSGTLLAYENEADANESAVYHKTTATLFTENL